MTKTKKRATKEERLAKVIGGKVPYDVLVYMRKNPQQIFRSFQNKKSIFGRRTKNLSPSTLIRVKKNLKTIYDGWKTLYTPTQLSYFRHSI